MTIAISPGLSGMAAQLRERGYNVVEYGRYSFPIDALVYLGGAGDYNVFTDTHLRSASRHFGILMVNAENKTVDEVDSALKRRLYSPLF